MRHLKSARVYRAPLPAEAHLAEALAKLAFQEITETQAYSCGFVPVIADKLTYATPDNRFTHFKFRLDQKVIPADAVKAELEKRVQQEEETHDVKLGRKAIAQIKDIVLADLRARALHRTTVISLFHDRKTEFLIAATTNKGVVDRALDRLVRALGSLKTTTIHVDSLSNGLTSRLRDTIFSQEPRLEPFSLEGDYWLESEGEKVTILSAEGSALQEALSDGLQVKALRLRHELVAFNLTSDFVFKNIRLDEIEDREPMEPPAEAVSQLIHFTAALDDLCLMFDYKPPEDDSLED